MSDENTSTQTGSVSGDASYMTAEQIKQRIAAIRANRGLSPDAVSDEIWVNRIMSGTATIGDARTAITNKAEEAAQPGGAEALSLNGSAAGIPESAEPATADNDNAGVVSAQPDTQGTFGGNALVGNVTWSDDKLWVTDEQKTKWSVPSLGDAGKQKLGIPTDKIGTRKWLWENTAIDESWGIPGPDTDYLAPHERELGWIENHADGTQTVVAGTKSIGNVGGAQTPGQIAGVDPNAKVVKVDDIISSAIKGDTTASSSQPSQPVTVGTTPAPETPQPSQPVTTGFTPAPEQPQPSQPVTVGTTPAPEAPQGSQPSGVGDLVDGSFQPGHNPNAQTSFQTGSVPGDASYTTPDQIQSRIAQIRENRGLNPDPASDQIWVDRVLAGTHSIGDARTAINTKAAGMAKSNANLETMKGVYDKPQGSQPVTVGTTPAPEQPQPSQPVTTGFTPAPEQPQPSQPVTVGTTPAPETIKNQVAEIRRLSALDPNPEEDQMWVDRIMAGTHTIGDATQSIQDHAASMVAQGLQPTDQLIQNTQPFSAGSTTTHNPDAQTSTQTGSVGGDSQFESRLQILARVAQIRQNRGLSPDSASDEIWADRVLAGTHTIGDARTAITNKAANLASQGATDNPQQGSQSVTTGYTSSSNKHAGSAKLSASYSGNNNDPNSGVTPVSGGIKPSSTKSKSIFGLFM